MDNQQYFELMDENTRRTREAKKRLRLLLAERRRLTIAMLGGDPTADPREDLERWDTAAD